MKNLCLNKLLDINMIVTIWGFIICIGFIICALLIEIIAIMYTRVVEFSIFYVNALTLGIVLYAKRHLGIKK